MTMAKEDEVSKINVGKFTVGIVGLKAALEIAAQAGVSPDEKGGEYLLGVLKPKNYIPSTSESVYAQAFLREYRKLKGLPVESDKLQGLEVKILGPGCINCDKLEQMVYKVMSTAGLPGSVEHVRDLNEIASYGIVPVPALVINGQIKCAGRLPQERQVLQWLKDAVRE
jgi:small redox-active disulfide protein 2